MRPPTKNKKRGVPHAKHSEGAAGGGGRAGSHATDFAGSVSSPGAASVGKFSFGAAWKHSDSESVKELTSQSRRTSQGGGGGGQSSGGERSSWET